MKILREDSETYKLFIELEQFVEAKGIRFETYGEMHIVYKGVAFRIGRDSNCFPRNFDEPFVFLGDV